MPRRARHICPKPGCPEPSVGRYCEQHQREYEQQRGTTSERGYGTNHQRKRAALDRIVQLGNVACVRCGQLIQPGEPWALDHDDDNRAKYLGPSHARCNNAAGGAAAQRYRHPLD